MSNRRLDGTVVTDFTHVWWLFTDAACTATGYSRCSLAGTLPYFDLIVALGCEAGHVFRNDGP
nr:hypothetical protein [Mycobacterium leprae]